MSPPGATGRCRSAAAAVGGAARIDDDDLLLGPGLLGGADAVERHRMGLGHVAADDEDHVGEVDVVVAAGRAVAAEAGAIAGHRRGHAQPAVGVGVVAAEMALEQLADQVDRLGVELAAAVEGDRLRAVRVEDVGEDSRRRSAERCPSRRPETDRAAATQDAAAVRRSGVWMVGPSCAPLRTDPAQVGRRVLDAADARRCRAGDPSNRSRQPTPQ